MKSGDVRSFKCDVYDFAGFLRSIWIWITESSAYMGTGPEWVGKRSQEGLKGIHGLATGQIRRKHEEGIDGLVGFMSCGTDERCHFWIWLGMHAFFVGYICCLQSCRVLNILIGSASSVI